LTTDGEDVRRENNRMRDLGLVRRTYRRALVEVDRIQREGAVEVVIRSR
jgi:hypothetical protein